MGVTILVIVNNLEEERMSYEEYKELCCRREIQPLGIKAFEAMVNAGFCFRSGKFIK